MLGKKKGRKAKSTRVDTLIGRTTTVKGDVTFAGSLHVEGTIIGNVRVEGDESAILVLDEDGMIEGDVDVPNLIINGTVQGDIFCGNHAELLPRARIKGNVYYDLIEMAVGSEVNGSLVHRKEESNGSVEYLDRMGTAEAGKKS